MNIFMPKTERISKLAKLFPERVDELSKIFSKPTNIYLDYANMFHWFERLQWHIDIKRLKQLFDSFSTIKKVRFYNGVLPGDEFSQGLVDDARSYDYQVTTKIVKTMHLPVDVSGIPLNSPTILQNFIKRPLLRQLNIETIEFLNTKLQELNIKGIKVLEHRKCNFDVEIGRDMLLDYERNEADTFILGSGDSDFADPVSQLINDGKNVYIFATVRRVSVELSQTKAPIFEIQKIRNFICRPNEIQNEVKGKI